MKKKSVISIGIIAALLTSTVVMAAEPTCKTWIGNGGKSASGSTSLGTATFCSAFVNAPYKTGGEETAYAEGISGATATAHAYSGEGTFDFAGTTHYAEDSSGTYMRTSSAYY